MKTLYFDTTYLFRLYFDDPGFDAVRQTAEASERIVSGWHGQAEFASALLRKRREGQLTASKAEEVFCQYKQDEAEGLIQFIELGSSALALVESVCLTASETTNLRAADALHLACAAAEGFEQIYSNDRRFIAAASLFGLEGVDVIP